MRVLRRSQLEKIKTSLSKCPFFRSNPKLTFQNASASDGQLVVDCIGRTFDLPFYAATLAHQAYSQAAPQVMGKRTIPALPVIVLLQVTLGLEVRIFSCATEDSPLSCRIRAT